MKYLFLISLYALRSTLYAPELPNDLIVSRSNELSNRIELYEMTIQHIIKVESFRSKPYFCPAGHKTIGYGHILTKKDTLTMLDKNQALKQLKIDFDKMFQKTNSKLKYNQRLAIAHFTFNTGRYYYEKSSLKRRVDANLPIDDLIIRYRFYRKNGHYIESNHLLKSRIFELNLYNL